MQAIQQAATTQELTQAVIGELLLRAWQERAVSRIGRNTKAKRDAHEHYGHRPRDFRRAPSPSAVNNLRGER